jgi:hypothetical protein
MYTQIPGRGSEPIEMTMIVSGLLIAIPLISSSEMLRGPFEPNLWRKFTLGLVKENY